MGGDELGEQGNGLTDRGGEVGVGEYGAHLRVPGAA